MFLCYKCLGQLSLHAPDDKFEIEQLDLSQAAKEKTRPNKQRAVTIRQVRVLYDLALFSKSSLKSFLVKQKKKIQF